MMRRHAWLAALFAAFALIVQTRVAVAENSGQEGSFYLIDPSLGTTFTALGNTYFEDLEGDHTGCRTLTEQQSPVNIANNAPGMRSGALTANYAFYRAAPVTLKVIKNDHTVEVSVPNGGPAPTVEFVDRSNTRTVFKLTQFHFHHPSEHLWAGTRYPMEMHLVHEAVDGSGRKLVIGRPLIARGPDFFTNDRYILRQLFRILDARKDKTKPAPGTEVEIGSIRLAGDGWPLPNSPSFADLISQTPDCCQQGTMFGLRLTHYVGSLTTPPCTSNVLWFMDIGGVGVTREEVEIFKKHYEINARPVQVRRAASDAVAFSTYDVRAPFAVPPPDPAEGDGEIREVDPPR